ncbi:MAG: hypothetical protein LBL80_06135 [Ruminococcus sp.]|jgi:hypothetical protein|nr:hypothetical protein [Ruminococcus sp.]
MEDIKRFSNTKEAKQMTAVFIINIVLLILLDIADIIYAVYMGINGMSITYSFELPSIFLIIIIGGYFINLITLISSAFASRIAKYITFADCGIIAYVNDGIKRSIKPNLDFLAIISNSVTITSIDTHDEESFSFSNNLKAKFKLYNLLAYSVLGVIFLIVSLFIGLHNSIGMIVNILGSYSIIIGIFKSAWWRKNSVDLSAQYIRYKSDILLCIGDINESLFYVTKYQFDPEPVRAFQIMKICSFLSDPSTNPDLILSKSLTSTIFNEYLRQERTDYPKIIHDYLEYYVANIPRLTEGKRTASDRMFWIELLYYLALTGRREMAIDEYNKRISYVIPQTKISQSINGCLRYILFNEDYSLWLYDKKNMQPTMLEFIHKWFEMPYIYDAKGTYALHKLIWEQPAEVNHAT